MFAGKRGGYHVKFVKPDNTVDRPRTGQIGHGPDIINWLSVILDCRELIDTGPGPFRDRGVVGV